MDFHFSKSRYCSALQCPKMLWLETRRPELFDDSVMNDTVLQAGTALGELARGLFGDFAPVPYGEPSAMMEATAALMAQGAPVIAEASFSWNGCFCSVDLLRNLGGGAVELYEVKSSASVKPVHLEDAAYQVLVLEGLGYEVRRAAVVHLDRTYVRQGGLDLGSLFAVEDVTDIVREKREETAANIARLRTIMEDDAEPGTDVGAQCFQPEACGFRAYCMRGLPKPNVFDVKGVTVRKMTELYGQGVVSFADLAARGRLSKLQMVQVEHALSGSVRIDAAAIAKELEGFSYPLYFLDFESFSPAVPPYDGCRPYDQIVFQYSLHVLDHEGDEPRHMEFLADSAEGADPRRALAERLCADIPAGACVAAYNMTFERERIAELARLFPDLAEHLLAIRAGIRDLMPVFKNRLWYDPAMEGSHSIKHVLPALFPGDPALDYAALDGVHDGGEASAAFAAMADMDAEERERMRRSLLAYCRLDTLAMVKIWQKLREKCFGGPAA